jgi:anthraniloyl-CoA monooxygenase
MAMYSAKDGVAGDFHLVHLGARAQGGAGLVFTEMTCVGPQARITPGCAGMYDEAHVAAWTRIVDFVHAHSEAKICLQLGHAGPKGSTRLGWDGMDEPLETGNWPLIGPSAVAWSPAHQLPQPMTRADMQSVLAAFVRATAMAERCGFDMIELHCAHGYLLSAFITPLSNRRTDAYGGTLDNRLRFPLEVFSAIRAAWPEQKPMSVRISATDWVDDGICGEDSVAIAKAFAAAGADVIDVSAGQTSTRAAPVYGRMFQTPFADRIRNEAAIATMAVGNIFEPDHVNGIIAAGRADICCLARPHLADPYWSLHAAAKLGYEQIAWPLPYLAGRDQLVRNLKRVADLAVAV